MDRDFFLPRRGALYVSCVVLAGGVVIATAVSDLVHNGVDYGWWALAALTLLSGSATVRLPSVPATISISETFVFTSVLLYGAGSGAAIVALDGLIISFWFAKKRKDLYRIAFNMAAPAISIWVAANLYYSFPDLAPLAKTATQEVDIEKILFPLLVFTLCHFLVNSWLIAFAVSFETGRRPFQIWRNDFLWLSLNYFGGASVAALLVLYTREIHYTYVGIIIPLLLILYFTFKIPMARVEDANRHLQKVNQLYLSTIETLALAVDAKDQVTHGHIRRVQAYACGLAKAVGIEDDLQLKAIEASALLHDMGKLAIPEHILNKPGKLTAAEFEKMKLHASIGADMLSSIEFPYPVVPIVRHHHENWNGTGYPLGLAGVEIPIGARILSVVDCFDALTSDRPYRPALSDAAAIDILLQRRGTMYDPLVVDTFIRIHADLAKEHKLERIAEEPPTLLPVESLAEQPQPPLKTSDDLGVFRVYQTLSDYADRGWLDASDLVIHRLSQVIPFQKCLVFSYDSAADELVCQSAHGDGMHGFRGTRRKMGEGLSGWVAANRRGVRNSNPALDTNGLPGEVFNGLQSTLSVPLIENDGLIGVLTVYAADSEAFSDFHNELLDRLAPRIARLVKRSQVFPLGNEPLLPGYPGPYHLDTFVRQRMQGVERGSDLCLLVLQFTSQLPSHDPVAPVKRTIDLLSGHLRGGDLVFVCGPTTLVYLLADATESEATAVRARLENVLKGNSGQTGQTELALVVAPRDGQTLAQLLSAANRNFATIPASQSSNYYQQRPFY